jgi:hypothetical protein
MNAPTSFRLSETALKLLDRLSSLLGLKRSAVMELALRELAKKHKVREWCSRETKTPPPGVTSTGQGANQNVHKGDDMANSKSTRKSTRKATQRNGAAARAEFEKFAATIEDEEIASSGALSLMAWIASLCQENAREEMARVDAEIRYLDPSAA